MACDINVCKSTKITYEILWQDCIALLAYERPIDSPVGYLLMFGQREAVADVVNSAVLATDPLTASSNGSQQSSLEKLLRQLTACQTEIWTLNGSQGELFKLQNVLRGKDGSCWFLLSTHHEKYVPFDWNCTFWMKLWNESMDS